MIVKRSNDAGAKEEERKKEKLAHGLWLILYITIG